MTMLHIDYGTICWHYSDDLSLLWGFSWFEFEPSVNIAWYFWTNENLDYSNNYAYLIYSSMRRVSWALQAWRDVDDEVEWEDG